MKTVLKRYARTFEASTDGIALVGFDGRFLYLNSAFARINGYSEREELLGLPWQALYASEAFDRFNADIFPGFRKTGHWRGDVEGKRRDGTSYDQEISLTKMGDTGFIAMIHDITERKKAGDMAARLASIVESSYDAIISQALDGRITSWNSSAERMYGYAGSEVMGRQWSFLLPEQGAAEMDELLTEVRAGRLLSHRETLHLRKDGQGLRVSLTASPVRDVSGQVTGTSMIIRDISEEKRMEETLRRSEEQLRQSQKIEAVGRLASGVAHEINNPLGVILGFAQSLKSRLAPGDPYSVPVGHIAREAVRCKDLVQNLLVFSRSHQAEHREMVDAVQTVEQALSLAMAQGRIQNIELIKEFSPDVPRICVNGNQLQQIMVNLSGNAIDAMPAGGTLSVKVRPLRRNGEDWVSFEVADTGVGIPAAVKPRIYEPFFTTKDVGKGTGLGLSIVHEIVSKHGGTIACQSEEGRGTLFIVELPVRLRAGKGLAPARLSAVR